MANLDWSQCPSVESIPGKVSGAWVFRDTRLPVATVIENLEDLSVEEVMEQFDVTREQIAAVLEFVAQRLKTTIPPQVLELVNAHFRAAVMEGKTYADRCCGHAKHQRLSENITKAVRGNSRFNLNSEVES